MGMNRKRVEHKTEGGSDMSDEHTLISVPKVTEDVQIAGSLDDIVAVAERRLESHKRILEVALKITNHTDWVDMNGKPYPTGSGAEKIAGLFGVQIRRKDDNGHDLISCEKEWGEDDQGRYYFYTVMGEARLKSNCIVAMGTCSSRDQFFAKVGGEWRPMSEVDETNIKKSAYTNFMVNVITRLLGLRNLTWEQVSAGGIDRSKTGHVTYGKKDDKRVISDPQHSRLMAIASGKKVTTDVIKAKFGLESTKNIIRDQYEEICKWVEGGGKEAPNEDPAKKSAATFFEQINPFIASLGVRRVKNALKQIADVEDVVKVKDPDQQALVLDLLRSWSEEIK